MPVTRDLSPAKRAAILKFLDDPQPGVKPPRAAAPVRAAVAPEQDRDASAQMRGGEMAALARIKSGQPVEE